MENKNYIELKDLIESNLIWKGMLHLKHTPDNEDKLRKLFDIFPSFCICREDSEQSGQHYHFFCFLDTSTIKLTSFKKNIITIFPELKREGKGGEHKYSCGYPKKSNQTQYFNYLDEIDQKILQIFYVCKDWSEKNKSIKKNFNKTKIYQNLYFDLKQKNINLKIEDQKNNVKEKQSLIRTLELKIRLSHTTKGADGNDHFQKPVISDVLETVCHHFTVRGRLKNKHTIKNIVETLMCQFDPIFYEEYKDSILNMIKN
jgi:hypothetical protein